MIIDIHAHIIVPEMTRPTAPSEEWRPNVTWVDGCQLIEYGGRRIRTVLREFVDIETMLIEHEKAGVGAVVLTPWSSLFRYDTSMDEGLRTSRLQNDALAEIATRYGPRVAALGTVPLQNVDAAVSELKRAVHELGLLGVEIGTNVNGIYLGDDTFRPFWAAVEELGAFVEIHPVSGVGGTTKREFNLQNSWGNPAETALTASHMILSGLLDEHPDLKICLFHGGGFLPYQIGRLDRSFEMRADAKQHINAPPSIYFKKFYFDTVTHSSLALSFLINLVGVEQVMMGSDYPFDMGYERPAEMVEQLPGLSREEKLAILGGNAQRVLQI